MCDKSIKRHTSYYVSSSTSSLLLWFVVSCVYIIKSVHNLLYDWSFHRVLVHTHAGYVKHTKHLFFLTTLSQQRIKHLLRFLFPSHLMHPCHYFSRHLWSENLHWSFPCEKLEHYDAKNVHVTSQSGYPCLSILWGNVTQCCIKN